MKSLVLLLAISLNMFAVNMGEVTKELILSGENGGLSQDGSAWNSSSTAVGRITIVNLATTWKPNYVIEKNLDLKQKELPTTI